MVGSLVAAVAAPFQVWELTGSSLAVGLVGAAEIIPVLLLALVGGALADRVDHRLMVAGAEVAQGVASLVLAWNASRTAPSLAVIVVASIVAAGAYALERPSLDALVPRLVDPRELPAAAALTSVQYAVGSLVGPVGARPPDRGRGPAVGLRARRRDVRGVGRRAARDPRDAAATEGAAVSLRGIAEGLAFARARPVLLGTYASDIVVMLFGMPEAVLPQLADGLGGARSLGVLVAAPAVGSLALTLTSGWTAAVRRGAAVVLTGAAYGLAIAVAGLVDGLWPVAALLAVAGGADQVSGLFRQRIWNETIPDRLRGRLAGIEMLSWSSGPLLGRVESGAAEALVGLRGSLVGGGLLATAAVAACAAALPAYWRDRAGDPPAEADA